MREKNPNQIIRIDGRGVFLEVIRNCFNIGKVQINFIEYDPKNNNQQTKNIPLFIDMDKFLVLANDILTGRISALANKERERVEKLKKDLQAKGKETKYIYCKEIFTDMGGIPSAKLVEKKEAWAERHPNKPMFRFDIPEGKALSRQFKITPGASQPWIFSGEQGIGDDNNETGLIVPVADEGEKSYRPKEIVRVPLTSDEDLKRFALVVTSHINAFITAQYIDYVAGNKPKN